MISRWPCQGALAHIRTLHTINNRRARDLVNPTSKVRAFLLPHDTDRVLTLGAEGTKILFLINCAPGRTCAVDARLDVVSLP